MSKNFSNRLSHIKTPKVEAPLHQRKLKNAVQSVYFNKDTAKKGSSLFDDLKHMSLKKLIPATVLAVFVFTLAGQSFLSWRNTAYAQELIEQTIHKIESEPLTEEEQETLSTIEILEEMKKEGELKFLGEEPYPPEFENGPERTMKKFSFTDEDLSNDLVIYVLDDKEVSMGMGQDMYEDYEVELDKEGKIIDPEGLKEKLKDPNLKKSWILKLVHLNNEKWLKSQARQSQIPYMTDDYFEGLNLTEEEKQKEREAQQKCDIALKNLIDQITPFIKEAQVPMNGFSWGCDEDGFGEFKLDILPIAGQKERLNEAREEIRKAMDKMAQFDTDSAKKKIDVLEKALNSKQLKAYPNSDNSLFTFPYEGAGDDEDLYIRIDLENQTEDFISFTFKSETLILIPGQKGEWVDVRVENGEISNSDALKVQLKDPHLKDETLRYIIKEQNKSFLDGIKKYEIDQPDKFEPLIFSQYDAQGRPDLKLKVFNQLQEIIKEADVPIMEHNLVPSEVINDSSEWSIGSDQDPKVLYSLGLYPLGQVEIDEDSEAIEKLDVVIENLKKTINPENQATLELLKHALEAKDLKYEGSDEDGDQLSFSDPSIPNNIRLVIKEEGKVYFTLDAGQSFDMKAKLEIKIGQNDQVTNLEEIEARLKDPNLKTPWIKELVRMINYSWLQGLGKTYEYTLVPDGLSEKDKISALEDHKRYRIMDEKCKLKEKAIAMQIENIIKNSEVSILGSEGSCGMEAEDFKLYVYLYPVTEKSLK